MKYRATLLFFTLLVASPLWADSLNAPAPLRTTALTVRSATVIAEIAQRPEELSRGLMYRDKMADNAGMIFVLTEKGQAQFWMENTRLPLSIAFISENGTILEIRDMQPLSREIIKSKSHDVRFALEMNQGWFALNQVRPGDVLTPQGTSWTKLITPPGI